jgi:hypothetical protein
MNVIALLTALFLHPIAPPLPSVNHVLGPWDGAQRSGTPQFVQPTSLRPLPAIPIPAIPK